jgi:hypothetical protein
LQRQRGSDPGHVTVQFSIYSGKEETMTKHNERHGGAYDRGRADFWYGRPFEPHYFTSGTGTSDKVTFADMTPQEIEAYRDGYDDAEACGDQKDWD